MIEINLLPEELKVSRKGRSFLQRIPPRRALGLFLAFFFAAQVLLTVFSLLKQLELAQTKQELMRLKQEYHTVIQKKTETGQAMAKLKQVQGLTARKFTWSQLLNALSDSVTKGVWLRTLSVVETEPLTPVRRLSPPEAKGKKLKVPGDGEKLRSLKIEGSVVAKGQETAYIGKFIKELKTNALFIELFDDIDLSNINQKKIKDVDVYDFTLTCVFRKGKIDVIQ